MRAGQAARCAGGLALGLTLGGVAAAAEWGSEIRILSGPNAATTVTLRAEPDVEIEDRTVGAKPAEGPRGPASTGETFTGELSLFLHARTVSRPAAIDVGDPVVSTVRLFPEMGGTTVTIFVRQPVTYTVSRPSAIGEVRIELKSQTRPVTVTGVTARGRPRVVRPPPTGEHEVAVDAESLSYDQQANTLTARGGVTLTRGDTTLTADQVVYDRTNKVAEASGHVVVTDPQATVTGDFAHLNLEDESGWIENANATLLPSRFNVEGARLDKKGGPRYSVANGVFTTCECGGLERPSWSVCGRQTDIQLQGTGVVHGMTFRVKDVPALYLPYFVFPANNQRQSGLLIPRISYSTRRGYQYEQAYFWAISKSTDATLALDVETAARVGLIGEYRYMLSKENRGQFTVAYYNEQIRGRTEGTAQSGEPVDSPENRFIVAGRHNMPLSDHSRFYLNLMAVSDDTVLREVNSFAFAGRGDLGLRSTRYTTSQAGVIKTWPEGLAWMETAYYQDLIDPQGLALEKLPRLLLEHGVPLLGDHLVGRVAAEAVDYQRQEGYAGLRADLAPELFLPFRLGRALNGSLTGQLRETAYHLTDTEQVELFVPTSGSNSFRVAPQLPALDADHSRELAQVSGRLGTEFERVFAFQHFGIEKLKHTIEPELQYLYVPPVARPIFDRQQCDQFGGNCAHVFSEGYLFDERDAINRRNFISYGVTSRLLGRGPSTEEAAGREAPPPPADGAAVDLDTLAQGVPADAVPGFVGPPTPSGGGTSTPAPRELLRASILHGYDISRTLVGSSHESDVDIGLRLTPVDYLGISYNTTVNLGDASVRGTTVGGVLREPWWSAPAGRNYQSPSTLGLSYHFVEKGVNRDLQPGAESLLFSNDAGQDELDGSIYLRLGDYLGLAFLSRYSLGTTGTGESATGPHFQERDYLLRLISRCNCWVIEAGVADKTNPDERLFRIQFTLVGLGTFGRPPTSRRSYAGLAPMAQPGMRGPVGLGGGLY